MKCCRCGQNEGTLEYKKHSGAMSVRYVFCEECYKQITKSGLDPYEVMLDYEKTKGKVCESCGTTLEEVKKSLLFGCPDCYKYMKEFSLNIVFSVQNANQHIGKKL